jgi:hypothetical protein
MFHSFVDFWWGAIRWCHLPPVFIRPVIVLDSVGINIATDDVLFNLVMKDTQLMKDTTPLRGGGEKDPLFL